MRTTRWPQEGNSHNPGPNAATRRLRSGLDRLYSRQRPRPRSGPPSFQCRKERSWSLGAHSMPGTRPDTWALRSTACHPAGPRAVAPRLNVPAWQWTPIRIALWPQISRFQAPEGKHGLRAAACPGLRPGFWEGPTTPVIPNPEFRFGRAGGCGPVRWKPSG